MKKALLIILYLILISSIASSQPLTLEKKLYYSCKIWGFAKYFHSNVSTCNVNWDSVLIANLPKIVHSTSDSEFNDDLDSMLLAAGPMALATSYFPDTLPVELKRNRNFDWITSPELRSDVQITLDTIKNNFRPHSGCYVIYNSTFAGTPGYYGGILLFLMDQPLLDVNSVTAYPDEAHRLLLYFKLWNIVRYFNPYNYVLDRPIDSVFFDNVVGIDTAPGPLLFYYSLQRFTAELNDAHADGLTYSQPITYPNRYLPEIALRYIEGNYIVVKSGYPAIKKGDAIVSIDDRSVSVKEDSLKNYVSAGNQSVFRRILSEGQLLWGTGGSTTHIVFSDTLGNLDSANVVRSKIIGDPSFFPYISYLTDSLANIQCTTFECGVGYVNTANLSLEQADSVYLKLQQNQVIIVDMRNATSTDAGGYELAYNMAPMRLLSAVGTTPDVTYPGTYYWDSAFVGSNTNPLPSYTGTVIVLVNEKTQSHSESFSADFAALPNKVITIGSQTAGADGTVSYFQVTKDDIHTGFTTTGYYYPNKDSIQRIGIRTNIYSVPTRAGIIEGRDEVLEKAIEIGCNKILKNSMQVERFEQIMVSPNPANNQAILSGKNFKTSKEITINICDVFGHQLEYSVIPIVNGEFNLKINMNQFNYALFFVHVKNERYNSVIKLIRN